MRNTVRATIDAFTHYLGDQTGRPTQDIRFPKKLIYYYLGIFRNAVVYEESKKRNDIDISIMQTIPCIDLNVVDVISDCPCAAEKGCKWLKTKIPLPALLTEKPDSVSSLDGNIKFEYVKWTDFKSTICSRYEFIRKTPYYTFKTIGGNINLYIYSNAEVTKTLRLKRIAVTARFKDQLDAITYPVCGNKTNSCSILDMDFLIPQELESVVFQRTYAALMSLNRLMMPSGDIINNNNNDSAAKAPL